MQRKTSKLSTHSRNKSLNDSFNALNSLKPTDSGLDKSSVTIKVFCRLRPVKEDNRRYNKVNFEISSDKASLKWPKRSGNSTINEMFPFTKVFNEDATQEQIYMETARNVVDSFIKGYNCS